MGKEMLKRLGCLCHFSEFVKVNVSDDNANYYYPNTTGTYEFTGKEYNGKPYYTLETGSPSCPSLETTTGARETCPSSGWHLQSGSMSRASSGTTSSTCLFHAAFCEIIAKQIGNTEWY